MMTVWAGRLTPHASVAVDTSTCRSAKGHQRQQLMLEDVVPDARYYTSTTGRPNQSKREAGRF